MQETILSNFENLAEFLANFLNKNKSIFLKCEPEIVDFRKDYEGHIFLMGKGENICFNFPKKHLVSFVGILSSCVLGEDMTVYSWDIKKLFSYIYYRWVDDKTINTPAKIIDIKYGEAFLGINEKCPSTFIDAENRAKKITQNEACMRVHEKIHLPLALTVLPKVEVNGICDLAARKVRHTVYKIEGQSHGRFKVAGDFEDALLVHTLTQNDRANLKPKTMDGKFILFDYKAMEVFVLEWLTKDRRLGKIIESGRDIYQTIYYLLYGTKGTAENRKFIKDTFLPVIYGMQSKALAARVGISEQEASDLIFKINKFFQEAMSWIGGHIARAKNGEVVTDYFGRPRYHGDKYWVVRNAIIQGPAAIVCAEKLIQLHNVANVSANIHDAYLVEVQKNKVQETIFRSLSVLEKPSEMCAGLKLRVGTKTGDDLLNMVEYPIG